MFLYENARSPDAPTRDLHRGAATTVLTRLLDIYRDRTVVRALDDAPLAPLFDRVLTLGHGHLLDARAPETAADRQEATPEAARPPSVEVVGLPAAS
jgi:ABC-type transport system involved in cytochrome bd biosynthesis fused ATPase/permease subunit